MSEKLLRKQEVAAKLGVSLRTVDGLISSGKLKVIRPAGLDIVRIEPEEVDRVIAESRVA